MHQHVTNEVFQGQGQATNVDILASLGLFLDEVENQRRTKRPRMSGFKANRRGVEEIKKIRERQLHRSSLESGVKVVQDNVPQVCVLGLCSPVTRPVGPLQASSHSS